MFTMLGVIAQLPLTRIAAAQVIPSVIEVITSIMTSICITLLRDTTTPRQADSLMLILRNILILRRLTGLTSTPIVTIIP